MSIIKKIINENEIVLPVPCSHVVAAGIGGKEEYMKQVKVKIETTVETMLGDKSVNEFLGDVADICHTSLEYSTPKQEGCETLYEDGEYEDYRNDTLDLHPRITDKIEKINL